jgi:predicted hydrolase (HD superfamily)
MAEFLGEDKEKWALVGLLHDVDFDKTFDDPKKHSLIAVEILEGKVDEEIIHAVKSHNFENTGVMPESRMDFSLIAADAISGLIIACALVIPSKKLADVKADSIARRYKEKDFARNCSRDRIYVCEKVGIDRVKFAEIALKALQSISEDLGL